MTQPPTAVRASDTTPVTATRRPTPDRRKPAKPWRSEVKASMSLGWPIILTNLAQLAILTTDVILIGRLGPEPLAAGSLSI
ncbi:MAG TPA: hypothetical protein VFR20_04325, partial [Burkholderiaceae bacterium]|nr:hypothetical protein [Burkholderiaceae bacterium]